MEARGYDDCADRFEGSRSLLFRARWVIQAGLGQVDKEKLEFSQVSEGSRLIHRRSSDHPICWALVVAISLLWATAVLETRYSLIVREMHVPQTLTNHRVLSEPDTLAPSQRRIVLGYFREAGCYETITVEIKRKLGKAVGVFSGHLDEVYSHISLRRNFSDRSDCKCALYRTNLSWISEELNHAAGDRAFAKASIPVFPLCPKSRMVGRG